MDMYLLVHMWDNESLISKQPALRDKIGPGKNMSFFNLAFFIEPWKRSYFEFFPMLDLLSLLNLLINGYSSQLQKIGKIKISLHDYRKKYFIRQNSGVNIHKKSGTFYPLRLIFFSY